MTFYVEYSHDVTKDLHGSEADDLTQTETQNKLVYLY